MKTKKRIKEWLSGMWTGAGDILLPKIKGINGIKITAILVSICFVMTSVCGEAIGAIADRQRDAKQFNQIFEGFTLPYSYGKITYGNYGGSDSVVINIQDLHSHPDVQKNISKIIETFDKKYGVERVYLEGAYGDVDVSWLGVETDKDKREQILELMIDSGRLTGAEYYAVNSGREKLIKGLESKKEYLDNLVRFGKILDSQGEIEIILGSISEDIRRLKDKYYNHQQNKLDKLSKEYSDGKIDGKKYFTLLYKHTDKLGIDIYKYENIDAYKMLLEEEGNLNYKRITLELGSVIAKLKEVLPYQAYKMIMDNTNNFSEIDKLYVYLIKFAREYKIDLDINYPNLARFLGYVELSQKINPLELIKEESKLVDEIRESFGLSRSEREVSFMVEFEKYLRDFLSSKITADDYEYYKVNKGEFDSLWVKYIDNAKKDMLDRYIEETEKFYEVNIKRNDHFLDNIGIEKNKATVIGEEAGVERVVKELEGKKIYVVVTGGFHTEGVYNELVKRGITALVVTPNVSGGVKAAEEKYYQIAKEQSKVLFQALAALNLTQYVNGMDDMRGEYAAIVAGTLVNAGKIDNKTLTEVNEFLKKVINKKHGEGDKEIIKAEIEYRGEKDIRLVVEREGSITEYNYDARERKFKNPEERERREKSEKSINAGTKAFLAGFILSVSMVIGSIVILHGAVLGMGMLGYVLLGIAGVYSIKRTGKSLEFSISQKKVMEDAIKELVKRGVVESGEERLDFRILGKVLNNISGDLRGKLINKMLNKDITVEKLLNNISDESLRAELMDKMLKEGRKTTVEEVLNNIIGKGVEIEEEIKNLQDKMKKAGKEGTKNEEIIKMFGEKQTKEEELSNLSKSLDIENLVEESDVAMYFDETIHLNYPLLSVLFFDENGNIKNRNLLEVFIRHELRHADWKGRADRGSKIAGFIHKIEWLEELIVSLGDSPDYTALTSEPIRRWIGRLFSRKDTEKKPAEEEAQSISETDSAGRLDSDALPVLQERSEETRSAVSQEKPLAVASSDRKSILNRILSFMKTFRMSTLSFVSKFRRAPNSIDSDLEEGFRKYLDEFYEKDGIKDAG
ncbi:MAG: hypothetical protein LBD46_07780, partial [Endomicrobium sp.]|nr:hypothetical protein [Endomicrobium sp.]